MKPVTSFIIDKALHKATGKWIDIRLGWQMMRSSEVSFRWKSLSVGIGCGLTALLLAFEVPVEFLAAAMVPFIGFFGDASIDGLEIILAPVILSVALLPILVRRFQPEFFAQPIRIESDR